MAEVKEMERGDVRPHSACRPLKSLLPVPQGHAWAFCTPGKSLPVPKPAAGVTKLRRTARDAQDGWLPVFSFFN
jgi:hypothetical protein